ncbi:type VI immunity family protein [Trinickia sp. NRRL B-1857]|uniref:type VI immunity family protein n=1 Tax=Trinickia sp. NRRL B-1857 TaxID=3162879 RepID=UPI003D2CF003
MPILRYKLAQIHAWHLVFFPVQFLVNSDWRLRRSLPLDRGGLIFQAGIEPVAAAPIGNGIRPGARVAYILLNHALRPIVADKSGILQLGTINSAAPLLNTTVAIEA